MAYINTQKPHIISSRNYIDPQDPYALGKLLKYLENHKPAEENSLQEELGKAESALEATILTQNATKFEAKFILSTVETRLEKLTSIALLTAAAKVVAAEEKVAAEVAETEVAETEVAETEVAGTEVAGTEAAETAAQKELKTAKLNYLITRAKLNEPAKTIEQWKKNLVSENDWLQVPNEIMEIIWHLIIEDAFDQHPLIATTTFLFASALFATTVIPAQITLLLTKMHMNHAAATQAIAAANAFAAGVCKSVMGKSIDGLVPKILYWFLCWKGTYFPIEGLKAAIEACVNGSADFSELVGLIEQSDQYLLAALALVMGGTLIGLAHGVESIAHAPLIGSIAEEAAEALHHGTPGLSSIELSFIALKTGLLIKSLGQGTSKDQDTKTKIDSEFEALNTIKQRMENLNFPQEEVQKVDGLISKLRSLYNVGPQQENALSEAQQTAQQTELQEALQTLEEVTKKLYATAEEPAANITPVNHELITIQGKDLLVIKDNEGNTVDIMFEGSDTHLLQLDTFYKLPQTKDANLCLSLRVLKQLNKYEHDSKDTDSGDESDADSGGDGVSSDSESSKYISDLQQACAEFHTLEKYINNADGIVEDESSAANKIDQLIVSINAHYTQITKNLPDTDTDTDTNLEKYKQDLKLELEKNKSDFISKLKAITAEAENITHEELRKAFSIQDEVGGIQSLGNYIQKQLQCLIQHSIDITNEMDDSNSSILPHHHPFLNSDTNKILKKASAVLNRSKICDLNSKDPVPESQIKLLEDFSKDNDSSIQKPEAPKQKISEVVMEILNLFNLRHPTGKLWPAWQKFVIAPTALVLALTWELIIAAVRILLNAILFFFTPFKNLVQNLENKYTNYTLHTLY